MKNYGLELNGARLWQFWGRVLYILETDELNDEVIPTKAQIDFRDLSGPFLTVIAWTEMDPYINALQGS